MDKAPIDDQFKKYFEEHHLIPGDKVWDRLDAMLTVSEKIPRPASLKWQQFAAGIAIVICVGIWWSKFTGDTYQKNESSIVNKHEQADHKKNLVPIVNHKDMAETVPAKYVRKGIKSDIHLSKDIQINQEKVLLNSGSAVVYAVKEDELKPTVEVFTHAEHKVLNVSEETFVINHDILLEEVEKGILLNKKISKTSRIDPKALLAEAELNAERSFLKKVYKNIQEGAETVIAVVSNRNYTK